jgi:hypothetical protein
LADAHGEVRDALKRIGFESQYGALEEAQTVDRVIAEWESREAGSPDRQDRPNYFASATKSPV